jgi:PAS domain S-box-containing protein
LEVNQALANVEGFHLTEFIGHPLWEVCHWNYSEQMNQWIKTAIVSAAQEQPIREEIEVLNDQGDLIWLDFSLKPMKNERDEVVLLILESRDISDRKLFEARMFQTLEQERELNQLKSDFVAMASHEFRTPLTTIRMATELLQNYNHKLAEEQRTQNFERIHTAIASMLYLLDEVLLLGKADANGLRYNPTAVDLKGYCQEIIDTLQLTINSNHKIICSYSSEQINGEIDCTLVHYILNNLILNAIKYSPNKERVWFSLNHQGDHVILMVRDEGIGISLKDQQNLFKSFYRATNVGRIQGTGLGLSIVKKCVELHQGQIQVESEIGVGTTFTVRLPVSR